LKATNFCPEGNAACANGKKHFDIAAPGFDFPATSLANTCSSVEPSEKALHNPQTCAYWMIRSQDPNQNCDCNALNDPILR
jgi:hypothetical protein